MITTGIGMHHYHFENCLESCTPAARKKIRQLVKNQVHDYLFEYRSYACEACDEIMDKPYMYIKYDDNKVYETAFRCQNCRSRRLSIVEEADLPGRACPNCKEGTLSEELFMMWD
ncbi:hypothetical protein [Salisediminibacterium beveridgei]|uniref:Uncharacterized protein n=1 Tax=Salisediminibacterium beveridgei TaxID=632773 RepID=A0A1D7QZN3_9BACI|nr:hypothetical protein [Salisediminibacterium beveridgei]AOM84462.1 hypothetical protein BBEV_3146 [Salisediminibacterium beveridgei]